VRAFATYGACVFASIGELPETLADRSIPIELKRRSPGDDPIAPFRSDRTAHLEQLARQATRWAEDNAISVAATDNPAMPDTLSNRAADNWRVLLAVATVAGGNWPERAYRVAQRRASNDGDGLLEMLLADIDAVFPKDSTEIASADLVEKLVALEGRPWAELGKSAKPLTPNRLARMLKPVAIIPEEVGPETKRRRGYKRERFKEAFDRYLPPVSPVGPSIRPEPDETKTFDISKSSSPDDGWTDGECENPNNDGLLDGWTVAKGGNGQSTQSPKPGEPRSPEWRALPLEPHTIERLASEYRQHFYAGRDEVATDIWLRQALAAEGVFPEFIATEFGRVKDVVYAPLGSDAGR
jgi:hypothetical protein